MRMKLFLFFIMGIGLSSHAVIVDQTDQIEPLVEFVKITEPAGVEIEMMVMNSYEGKVWDGRIDQYVLPVDPNATLEFCTNPAMDRVLHSFDIALKIQDLDQIVHVLARIWRKAIPRHYFHLDQISWNHAREKVKCIMAKRLKRIIYESNAIEKPQKFDVIFSLTNKPELFLQVLAQFDQEFQDQVIDQYQDLLKKEHEELLAIYEDLVVQAGMILLRQNQRPPQFFEEEELELKLDDLSLQENGA